MFKFSVFVKWRCVKYGCHFLFFIQVFLHGAAYARQLKLQNHIFFDRISNRIVNVSVLGIDQYQQCEAEVDIKVITFICYMQWRKYPSTFSNFQTFRFLPIRKYNRKHNLEIIFSCTQFSLFMYLITPGTCGNQISYFYNNKQETSLFSCTIFIFYL